MNITRVVGNPEGECMNPGIMVDKDFSPDKTIIQMKSDMIDFCKEEKIFKQNKWELRKKEISRYAIDGKAIVSVKKTIDGERTIVENARNISIGSGYEGEISFIIGEKDIILGLGQHEDGVSNYRNCVQHLYQNNMQIPMPVFVSTAGFGVLFDSECLMVYSEKDNVITVHFDAIDQIDYYVIEANDLKDIVKGIRRITGKAELLPKWAYGYIQSKERYHSQEEILKVASEFKKRNIPVSCLVQDWLSWEEGKWGDKHLDKKRFPDLRKMTDELHDDGIAFMISVWPNINKGSIDNEEMADEGYLFANLSTYDAFDEEARKLYWNQCERELFSGGTDAWWCDSTEPFTPDWCGTEKKPDEERYELSKEFLTKYMDARKSNSYALFHAKGIYENQKNKTESIRVTNLTRSGYPSIQKYGTILWSGDIRASWDVLKAQIVEGMQMAASGIPYWTLDIGAFFVGNYEDWKNWSNAKEGTQPWFWNGEFKDGCKDKGYAELYTRWIQYGTFLPVMRSHGMSTPREPWNFEKAGAKYYSTIKKYIGLRYRLIPYIYSMAYSVYARDEMIIRPPVFDYIEDEKASKLTDEFLFGDFLVCPVTEPYEYGPDNKEIRSDHKRRVYLPKGDIWYDYESKEMMKGGTDYNAEAPIEKMPLYIKGGSIVPVNTDDANLDLYHEHELESIGIEIFTGKNGAFSVYFDSGNGYGYQSGDYSMVNVLWDDAKQIVTIEKKEGNYPVPEHWVIKKVVNGAETVYSCLYQGDRIELNLK